MRTRKEKQKMIKVIRQFSTIIRILLMLISYVILKDSLWDNTIHNMEEPFSITTEIKKDAVSVAADILNDGLNMAAPLISDGGSSNVDRSSIVDLDWIVNELKNIIFYSPDN
uniref:hypothetical protein n=1 Tax=Conidiobolus lichenicola TaxID=1167816 RepID=UPI001D111725|nr:hypothetical protein LK371_mgp06 [Conidiobolus lichenicola]QZZ81319.1 hypothetical protein [Conidiobolus lichenicola]